MQAVGTGQALSAQVLDQAGVAAGAGPVQIEENSVYLNGKLPQMGREFLILAALFGLSSSAFGEERSDLLRSVSCSVVRHCVAKYSEVAAEAWVRSKAAGEADIDAAKRCLTPETMRTAKARTRPLAVGS
jgi:hypothetical protein